MRYRSRIPNPAHVAPIDLVVEPGQEFESPVGLHHPELEPLDDEALEHAAKIALELEEHAAAYQRQVTGQAASAGPLPDHRAALGLPPLPPTPEPTDEERRIRGLPAPDQSSAASPPAPTPTVEE
jgi:hypothetical protein